MLISWSWETIRIFDVIVRVLVFGCAPCCIFCSYPFPATFRWGPLIRQLPPLWHFKVFFTEICSVCAWYRLCTSSSSYFGESPRRGTWSYFDILNFFAGIVWARLDIMCTPLSSTFPMQETQTRKPSFHFVTVNFFARVCTTFHRSCKLVPPFLYGSHRNDSSRLCKSLVIVCTNTL